MVIQTQPLAKPLGAAPPTFERVPQNCRFVQGGNALFELIVRGSPRPQVTWTRKGTPIVNSTKYTVQYSDSTGLSSLLISQLQKEDEGEYTCTASNQYGEAVCNVLIQTDVSQHLQQYQQQQQRQTQQQQQYQQRQTSYQQSQTTEQRKVTTSSSTSSTYRQFVQQGSFDGQTGAPYTNGVDETFKVDTFEYRLLREIEFRESKTRRLPGEPDEIDGEVAPSGPTSPPQILQRLRNSKITEGADATFQAKIAGNPKPKITWFRNGQRVTTTQRTTTTYTVKDQTATLRIKSTQPSDSGHYTLLAENSTGRVACSGQLVVEAAAYHDNLNYSYAYDQVDGIYQHTPTIANYATTYATEQDTSTVKHLKPNFVKLPSDKEVTEGKLIRFDCRVTGRPYPEVTWYLNGYPVLDDVTHKLIVNEAGNHSLLITAASRTDAGIYTCVARNKGGEVSFQVNLTVIEKEQVVAPKFVERFQTIHAREGEPVSLHCRAVGTPIPRITWQRDGVQIMPTPDCRIDTEAGSSSLYIRQAKLSDSAWYQCTAQNVAGSTATRARLFVESEQTPSSEPWKLSLPRPTKVIEPEREPEPEVVWLRHVERANYQTISHEEEPRVYSKPTFTHPLRNISNLQEGDRAHFEARLIPIGDPTMSVEWFYNGQPLPASSRFMTTYRFGYVALTILNVYTQDSGTFTCRARNSLGEDLTQAVLTVIPRATIESTPQHPESLEKIYQLEEWERYKRQESIEETYRQKPTFIQPLRNLSNLQEGQYAHFEAKVTPLNDPHMKVEWFFNNQPLTASSRITTIYNFGYVALNIMYLRVEDSGTYTCRVSNLAGEAISQSTLTVMINSGGVVSETGVSEQQRFIEKAEQLESYQRSYRQYTEEAYVERIPEFKTQLHDQTDIFEGQSAHFEAKLEPLGDPCLRVEWFKNNKPLEASSRITTFFNFGYVALTIKTVAEHDVGTYTCRAVNRKGQAISTATLTILTSKRIIYESQHPEGLEKIQHLEDASRYIRSIEEETAIRQLPRFTSHLRGPSRLKEGDTAHFEGRVEPVSDPNMKVEWFLNGEPLMSAHRYKTTFDFGFVALDILQVVPEDSGLYTVKATNNMGTATQTSELYVEGKSAIDTTSIHRSSLQKIQHIEDTSLYTPHYEIDESSRIKPKFTVILKDVGKPIPEGGHVHFECRVEPVGDPTMKVEWFVNGRPLTVGSRFKTIYDFGYVALDITTAYPEDSGEYTVRATNHLGSAHTSGCVSIQGKRSVILESQHPESMARIQRLEDSSYQRTDQYIEDVVKVQPRFTTKFRDLDNIKEGQNAHFECRLEPVTDPNLKVEWFKNGKPLTVGHRFRPIHDFGYVALDILGVVSEDSGIYTCRATNMVGSDEMNVRLVCKGTGEILTESQYPEGLQKIQHLEESSRYHREIISEDVSTQPPVFTSSIQNVELTEGQRTHFECRLIPVSDPNMKVEWFHNGRPLKSGSRFMETHNFGFVALDILTTYSEDSGTYTCKATNPLGSAVTSAVVKCHAKRSIYLESIHEGAMEEIAHLEDTSRYQRSGFVDEFVNQAPVFTQPLKNLRLVENQAAHFECRLIPVGDPKLKVEWFFNGMPLQAGSRVMTMNDFGFVALDLKYVKEEDSGTYTCKATNELGSAVTSSTLLVQGKSSLIFDTNHPEGLEKIKYLEDESRYKRTTYEETAVIFAPKFVTPLTGPTQLVEGQSTHFECRVEPHSDPDLKVEWFFNGKALQTGHRFRTVFDFGFVALDILNVYAEDSGTYSVKATNKLGTASLSHNINVKAKSSIILDTQHPEGLEKIHMLEDGNRYRRSEYTEAAITDKPQFGRPLRNLERVKEGQSAHLECTLTPVNDPTMKVEWFVSGRPIPEGHRFKTTYDFGYVALDILYAYSEDSGIYMCKATNANGEAVTTCSVSVDASQAIFGDTLHQESLARIQALETPHVTQRVETPVLAQRPEFVTPLVSNQNLTEGDHLHLECRLEPINDPKLRVEWFINGVEISRGHRFRTTHDFGYAALDILYAYPENSGTYMCKATNDMGEAVTTCSIQIQSRRGIYLDTLHPEGLEKIRALEEQVHYQPIEVEEKPITKPAIVSPLVGTTDLVEGQRAHFECRVEPAHDPKLTIQFYHNGKPLHAGSRFHVTFDFGYVALDIAHVFPEDAGVYTLVAKNELGEASSSITIRVQAKSAIISDTQHAESLPKLQQLEDESKYRRPEFVDARTFQRPVFTAPLHNLENLNEGDGAHLECRLIPVGDPTLKVEWYHNEKRLETSSRFTTTHDFGYVALDLTYVRPEDAGIYMCRAVNDQGEAVTTSSMKIRSKASIQYDTNNPEGVRRIRELEDGKQYRRPEAAEPVFDRPTFTISLTGPKELNEGQPAHFDARVIPIGDPSLRFEWYVNGVDLPKGTRFQTTHDFGVVTLDIGSVIPEDSGIYTCKAVNKAGEAVSSISLKVRDKHGVLTDTFHEEGLKKVQKFDYDNSRISEIWADAPSQRPMFVSHLSNFEGLVEGHNVHLEARLIPTNDEKLRVEWYKNGKTLTLGTRVQTTFDFGLVSLDISGLRPDDSGIYTCRAVNEVGEAVSTCTLRVEGKHWLVGQSQHPESLPRIQQLEEPRIISRELPDQTFDSPVFITHLNNVTIREGESAHFECRVEPAKDPQLKVEFFLNGKPLPLATRFTTTVDFGFISLDISHCFPEDSGVYMCKATNPRGQAATSGSLNVYGKDAIIYDTQHPMGQAGLEAVQFTEEAYLAKYQRQVSEKEAVYPKPTFVIPLQANFGVNENEGLTLECRVEPAADPKLQVEWFFNGKPLDMATRFMLRYDFGQVVLDISDLWPRDSGIYTCRAKNEAGEAFTSTTIQVKGKGTLYEETLHPKGQEGLEAIQDLEESLRHVEGAPIEDEGGRPPQFTSQFQNLTGLSEGDIAHFEASLTPAGDQTMVVEWFFRGETLKAGHRVRTVHAFGMVVLEILGVYIEDSGEYTCRATNKWGRAEITVQLECIDRSKGQKPQFTSQIQSLINLKEGDSAHFECNLVPVGDPTLKVEWFHNGQPLRQSSRIKTVSDFGFVVMDISFVHPEDSGEYVCKATNRYGEDNTRAVIKCQGRGTLFFDSLQPQSLDRIAELEGVKYVSQAYVEGAPNQPPRFQTHISSLDMLIEGQGAHFEATLTPVNDPNLKVEWYFNGVKLQHGHRFRTFHDFGIVILDILYCYEEDSGTYECRAVNKFGSDITKTTLKCKSKKSIIFESQLPRGLEGGLEKIQDLEDAAYRLRRDPTQELRRQAPVFTQPLQNVTGLRELENAYFEARLTPTDDPELRVEWFFNGKPIKTGSRIRTIHDFGFVVLEISPVYPEDSGEYQCRAKNLMGEAVTSCTLKCEGKRSVILETQLPKGMETGVEKIAALESYSDQRIGEIWADKDATQPPVFLTEPQDQTLPENGFAHFETRVTPVNDPHLRVEWYHNGRLLTAGSRIKTISDFGYVILEISGVYQRDAGVYTCKAINKHGEASVSCKLSVKGKLGIILEPQLPGQFKSGTESIQRLEESLYRKEETHIEEELPNPPVFITQIQDLRNVNEGEAAHFECRLEPVGDPTMRVDWYRNGKPLETGSRVHTLDDFGFVVLDIDWIFPRDSGDYVCRATNRWGVATTKATMVCKGKRDIIVDTQLPQGLSADKLRDLELPPLHGRPLEDAPLQPPKFITQIKALENLQEGDSAHFDCRLEPVNDPKLKVEWFHNGRPLMSGHRFKTIHDFGYVALTILYVYPEDGGEYTARAVNELGEDSTKTVLKCKASMSIILYNQVPRDLSLKKAEAVVQMEATLRKYSQDIHLTEGDIYDPDKHQPPKFVTQIQSRTDLKELQSAKFECQLSPVGDPDMKVEWFFNGRPLAFKNRFNPIYDFGYVALEFSWVYPEDSGEYICRATNKWGMDETKAVLKSKGKPSIIYDTQLPKEMEGSILKLQQLESSSWIKAVEEDETPRERRPPQFVVKLEPQIVTEGEWAKFSARVIGYPKARIMWLINGRTVTSGSRYKLSFDGLHHLDIPKSRQYDAGKIEVIARNSLGEAYCSTTLEVHPKQDDYRAVLKNSPRPWYDTKMKIYQKDRKDQELQRVFEERITAATSDVYHVDKVSREHMVTRVDKKEDFSELEMAFKKRRAESEALYKSLKEGEKVSDEQGITLAQAMAREYEAQMDKSDTGRKFKIAKRERDVQTIQAVPDPSESTVHGKEVHTQRQTQTQKEVQGDVEITRKTTVTETVEQEHKGVTKERIVKGPVPETKPPVFTKKIQPCRAFEGSGARFECEFTGLPNPTVTWYRENFPIKSSQDFLVTTTDKKSILQIREVYMEDSGVFSVTAENRGGTAKSTANLVVEERKDKRKGIVPPSFTVTIQDVAVKSGQLARLDSKVTGTKPMDVYWIKNGKKVLPDIRYKLLEEEDVYTLLIIEAFPEDVGTYECVAINQAGEARCQAKVQVEVPPAKGRSEPDEPDSNVRAPSIIEPLKDQTVTEGQAASFQCRVSAFPAPAIKWYRGSNLVKPSRYFKMSQEKDQFTLTISEAFPEDEGTYKCVAANTAGEITLSAHLRVMVPESAIIPPNVAPIKDVKVTAGMPARFVTDVSGTPTPTVQWYREGVLIPQSTDFQMTQEGTLCTLYVATTYVEDSGKFTCRASNPSGQAEASATLQVENNPDRKKPLRRALLAPFFVRQLVPLEVIDGDRAVFECQADGNPDPETDWFFNNLQIQPNKDFKIHLDDIGNAMLEILEVYPDDTGLYVCKATNSVGTSSTSAKLTVIARAVPPKFTVPLEPLTVNDGDKAILRCQVEGCPPPQIIWYKDDMEIAPSKDFFIDYNPASGEVTLSIAEVYPDDEGTIKCTAVNEHGKDETQAPLNVAVATEPPVITKALLDVSVPCGQPLELVVEVKGKPLPEVQWWYNGKQLKATDDFQFRVDGNKASLFITEVLAEDAGTYEARAVSEAGAAVSSAELTAVEEVQEPLLEHDSQSEVSAEMPVVEPEKPQLVEVDEQITKVMAKRVEAEFKIPELKEPPPSAPVFKKKLKPKIAPLGGVAKMEVEVTAYPEPTFSWFLRDQALAGSREYTITTEGNHSSLTINEVFEEDIGMYIVRAENSLGVVESKAKLTLDAGSEDEAVPPKFTFPLETFKVMDGEELRYTCRVSGKPMPKISWYHNGRDMREHKDVEMKISNDGLCELYISEVFPEDAGEYVCQAANDAGEAKTAAILTVESYEYIPDSEVATLTMTGETSGAQSMVDPDATTAPSGSEVDLLDDTIVVSDDNYPGSAPNFVSKLPQKIEADAGDTVRMECTVTGTPQPSVRWYCGNKEVTPSTTASDNHSEIHILYNDRMGIATLIINEVRAFDGGQYTCEATNCIGVDTTSALLHVAETAPMHPVDELPLKRTRTKEISQQPRAPFLESALKDTTVKEGTSVILDCHVQGVPKPTITWYINSREIQTSDRVQIKYRRNRASLTITTVLKEDHGEYTIRASNTSGTCVSRAYLYVESPDTVDLPSTQNGVTSLTSEYDSNHCFDIEQCTSPINEPTHENIKSLDSTDTLDTRCEFQTLNHTSSCTVTQLMVYGSSELKNDEIFEVLDTSYNLSNQCLYVCNEVQQSIQQNGIEAKGFPKTVTASYNTSSGAWECNQSESNEENSEVGVKMLEVNSHHSVLNDANGYFSSSDSSVESVANSFDSKLCNDIPKTEKLSDVTKEGQKFQNGGPHSIQCPKDSSTANGGLVARRDSNAANGDLVAKRDSNAVNGGLVARRDSSTANGGLVSGHSDLRDSPSFDFDDKWIESYLLLSLALVAWFLSWTRSLINGGSD